jgi:hypothetical protein
MGDGSRGGGGQDVDAEHGWQTQCIHTPRTHTLHAHAHAHTLTMRPCFSNSSCGWAMQGNGRDERVSEHGAWPRGACVPKNMLLFRVMTMTNACVTQGHGLLCRKRSAQITSAVNLHPCGSERERRDLGG